MRSLNAKSLTTKLSLSRQKRFRFEDSAVLRLRLKLVGDSQHKNELGGEMQNFPPILDPSHDTFPLIGFIIMHSWAEILHAAVDDNGAHVSANVCDWREPGELFVVLKLFTHNDNEKFSLFQFIRKISERTFFYQIVGNATYSVDTFFFIGGLLVVLLFLKADKKKRQASENIPSNFWGASLRRTFVMIFYRFLRLTPVYVVIIVFTELTMK